LAASRIYERTYLISYKHTSENRVSIHTSLHPQGLPFEAEMFRYRTDLFPSPLLRPADPNTVLEQLTEDAYEKDKFLPYWAEQWPSSDIILNYLKTCPIDPRNKIIELGCGLGIIAAYLSLRKHFVIATDISFDALLFSKANSELNNVRSIPCCVDWRALPFKTNFDLIVASDILYESRWIEPILSICKQFLKPGGRALIADPCRKFWSDFKKRAIMGGFESRIVCTDVIKPQNITVEILELILQ
jgi:SAM-dependent methyltransferase